MISFSYEDDFPAGYGARLIDLIRWFNLRLAEIPEEHRENATCCIKSCDGYEGSIYASIEISCGE